MECEPIHNKNTLANLNVCGTFRENNFESKVLSQYAIEVVIKCVVEHESAILSILE
jgi:hypothetical protein